MRDDCPFCDYEGPSEIVKDFGDAFVIEPLNPVCRGHMLVIPRRHVAEFAADPDLSGYVMSCAARYATWAGWDAAGSAYNVIVSSGEAATQTVFHLHVHVVPRRRGDGLALPWSMPVLRAND